LFWANSQIFENRHRVKGDWVYILDDDDFLTDYTFIQSLKQVVADNDIVICKGYIGKPLYPSIWEEVPVRATIGSPNFIVKKELFLKHADKWIVPRAGDFFFINAAYENAKVYWWDKIVFTAPIGSGMPEK